MSSCQSQLVPISNVLPWGDEVPSNGQTIVLSDSIETDGRFLLYTLASQCLFTSTRNNIINNGHIMWISCTCKLTSQSPQSQQQMLSALKKMSSSFINGSSSGNMSNTAVSPNALQVISVLSELSNSTLVSTSTVDQDEYYNSYIQKLYQRISDQFNTHQNQNQTSSNSPFLIILDDVSSLSAIFDCKIVYIFIQKLSSLLKRRQCGCLTILCSNDLDQEQYSTNISSTTTTAMTMMNENKNHGHINVGGNKKQTQYVGGGGYGVLLNNPTALYQLEQHAEYELHPNNYLTTWERSLIDLADVVVDIVPLLSGYARDVHGRLIFTQRSEGLPRRATATTTTTSSHNPFITSIVNYSCTDTGVKAIRLRSGT